MVEFIMSNNNIQTNQPDEFVMVIFGASGDLTMRKLIPAMYKNFLEGLLPLKYSIVGYARRDYSDDDFRGQMKEAIETLTKHFTQLQFPSVKWSFQQKTVENIFICRKATIKRIELTILLIGFSVDIC